MRRILAVPAISLGSAVWALGAFAVVPLFTILSGVAFWTLAAVGFLGYRTFRRRARRDGGDDGDDPEQPPEESVPATTEESVRSRVESLT